MFLGSNVHIGNMSIFGGLSEFESLLAEGTMVGRDLSVTNTRTGARKSVFADESAEVAANTADEHITNGLYLYGAMNGATNLVTTVLTDWTLYSFTGSAVDNGDYTYRITFDKGDTSEIIYDSFASASKDRHGKWQVKLVSGDPSELTQFEACFMATRVPVGTTSDMTTGLSTGVWTDVEASVTLAESSDMFGIKKLGTTTEDIVIDVRYARAVDSTVAHPAFPDGSAAGASYGGDSLTFTPSYTSTGYIAIPFKPYGWATTGNPANAQPLIFESGSFTIGLDATGFFTTNGGATSTKKPADDTLSIIYVSWDGVNHTISVDDETPVSAASAVAPTSTAYLGNTALGSKEAHAALSALIGTRELTASELTSLNTGMSNRLSGVTFR